MSRQPMPGDYSLDDLRRDLQKLGAVPPGGHLTELERLGLSPSDLKSLLGILDAMTVDERGRPMEAIDDSRCRRIAAGAGVAPSEVKELLRQFQGMQELVKALRRL